MCGAIASNVSGYYAFICDYFKKFPVIPGLMRNIPKNPALAGTENP
jgi:hypothetical protein